MVELFYKRKSVHGSQITRRVPLSNVLILQEAEKRGIEWKKISYTGLYTLTHKGMTKFFHYQTPSETTSAAVYCCDNKRVTRNLLQSAGISVSEGFQIRKKDKDKYKMDVFEALKKPIVVKPVDSCQGKNVKVGIETKEEYADAVSDIIRYYGESKVNLMVEEMFVGEEYRILVTKEKVLSVIHRIPANVIGNGKLTIEELIQEKNKEPYRGGYYPLKEIKIDDVLLSYLKAQQLSLQSVPRTGEQIFVYPKTTTPIDNGGDTVEVMDDIHPNVHDLAMKVIHAIPGLSLAGIDFMTKDITKAQTDEHYRVIEVNASPSIDWQELPAVGERRNIPYEFLKIMFPEL